MNTNIATSSNIRSRRFGLICAAAIAAISSLSLSGAVSSFDAHAAPKPHSGYTNVDASDHPANPIRCASRKCDA